MILIWWQFRADNYRILVDNCKKIQKCKIWSTEIYFERGWIATGDNPVSIHITNHTATLNLTEGKEVSGLFWEKSRIILNSIIHHWCFYCTKISIGTNKVILYLQPLEPWLAWGLCWCCLDVVVISLPQKWPD